MDPVLLNHSVHIEYAIFVCLM